MNEKCAHIEELISAMADGETTESENEEVFSHIAECDKCRALYTIYNSIRSDIPAAEPPENLLPSVMDAIAAVPAPHRKRGVFVRFASLAACACIAAVLVSKLGLFPPLCESEKIEDEKLSSEICSAGQDTVSSTEGSTEYGKNDSPIRAYLGDAPSATKTAPIPTFYIENKLPEYIASTPVTLFDDGAQLIYLTEDEYNALISDGYVPESSDFASGEAGYVLIFKP